MNLGRRNARAFISVVAVLALGGLAGCGDSGDDLGVVTDAAEDSRPTGTAAAPVDAAAACVSLARSVDEVDIPLDDEGPWVGGRRLLGAAGLGEAAGRIDPRFVPLQKALEDVADDVKRLNGEGLARTTIPAARTACENLRLPAEAGSGSEARRDAAAGCAAAGRSRNLFALTGPQGFTFPDVLRLDAAADFLMAASDANGDYRILHQQTGTIQNDARFFDIKALRKDGPVLLDACGRAGLPR